MRLLVDSHALLWWSEASSALGGAASGLIADPANEVLISVAALWELTIKASSGKLRLPADLETLVAGVGVRGPPDRARASETLCRAAPTSS